MEVPLLGKVNQHPGRARVRALYVYLAPILRLLFGLPSDALHHALVYRSFFPLLVRPGCGVGHTRAKGARMGCSAFVASVDALENRRYPLRSGVREVVECP